MKRGFVGLFAVGALVFCSLAFAAPQPLTNADLAQVTAGEANASTDNAVAVDGDVSANSAVGALADIGAAAVNGDENNLTADPSNSALAYADSQSISSGENSYGTATAVDSSKANYSEDPSESAVNLGQDNVATNFYANTEVANATDQAIALGDGSTGANALGANSQAFEDNSDVAVANNGASVSNANDAALNIGNGNLAIEDVSDVTSATGCGVAIYDPSDVAVAQDNGTAITNSGELAQSGSGIAFAEPGDTALAYGDSSVALLDSGDAAIASGSGLAVQSGLDSLIALDHSQAFEDNNEVANATGSAPAIATEGEVAFATGAGTVAIATPDDANVAINGNAAQNTSDGQAIAGNGNKSIFQESYRLDGGGTPISGQGYTSGNAIAAMDAAVVNVTYNDLCNDTIDDGSAAVIGNGNEVCASYDDANISLDPNTVDDPCVNGVVAKDAHVAGSFNDDETETEVTATISDSFNVNTGAMCISGQDGASGIALVNSLGSPESGINLNVTSASASVPVAMSATTAPADVVGTATATTTLTQSALNDSYSLTITF